MCKSHYYFSTHTTNPSIYKWLEAFKESKNLSEEGLDMLNVLIEEYHKRNKNLSVKDFCSTFIMKYKEQLNKHICPKKYHLKEFLYNFIGYDQQWRASTRSFGKNSKLLADKITEKDLIEEMVNPNKSLKKLLDASGGDLSAVKPFLPALMISLKTNTRDKSKIQFKHTGEFCFDFDKFKDTEEAIFWMEKVFEATENIKPYLSFISSRGKGFKLFCKVDTSSEDFIKDFKSEDPDVVKKHHKTWYEGARKELIKNFPPLEDKFDKSTNDSTRLTYIPFVADEENRLKYKPKRISNYASIVNQEKELAHQKLKNDIAKHQKEINQIMKEQGISSQEEAYYIFEKKKIIPFDLESETEKFEKVIEYLEELSNKDSVVARFVSEHFDDYGTLQKLSWVLYGVFGELAIDNLLKLVPEGSNKKDENHNDYRWTVRSKGDYSAKELKSMTPAPFYYIVRKLEEVDDFIYQNFGMSTTDKTEIKLLSDYYDTYVRHLNLEAEGSENADTSEFLDDITKYIEKKKIRLPLIEELETINPEFTLGPNDYLDKNVMHDLFQNKYTDKKIFHLRSQCGK
ncbi:BT4734/BF3469 family protein [uncultured Polaribacter sp.]|uniref:BT4734/BF3469 family protein n=1 Tax=uncultured Polaribacter sp. TaxID=174711 RepID=UPI002635F98A|nr:BT4734/BF3469 family protein [uncultured Polaribacter sp.]